MIFLKEEHFLTHLIVSKVTVGGEYLQVSPLALLSTRVIIPGVLPFVPNDSLEKELQHSGKLATGLKTVGLGCKDDQLKRSVFQEAGVYVPKRCHTGGIFQS